MLRRKKLALAALPVCVFALFYGTVTLVNSWQIERLGTIAANAGRPAYDLIDADTIMAITRLGGLPGCWRRVDQQLIWELGGQLNGASLSGFEFRAFPTEKLPSIAKPFGLYLENCEITPNELANLAHLCNLEVISLKPSQLTDANVRLLRENEQLHLLSVAQVDDHYARPKAAEEVTRFRLEAASLTDAGLQELKVFRNLKELWLVDAQVTDAGIVELRKHLPNCQIAR